MQTCLVLSGLARSGKDTLADYLVSGHGFKKFVFSDELKRIAARQKKKPSKLNLAAIGDSLRSKKGMDAVALLLLEHIPVNASKVVLVGARSPEEFIAVKKKFPFTQLVWLNASKTIRFSRKNESDPAFAQAFFSRDCQDIEKKGLQKLQKKAAFVLENDGSPAQLFAGMKKVLWKLKKNA
ncbi:MAG: hypothetical protein HY917_04165 [Candidatus Diapherotrites archaeon]|nr:hypothetical protein [Candidatus Diapherotrites archaeon]